MLKAPLRWVTMDLKMAQMPPSFVVFLSVLDWVGTEVEGKSWILPGLGFLWPESMVSGVAGGVLGHNCSSWTPGHFSGAWNLKLQFSREGWGSRCLLTGLLKWKPSGSILLCGNPVHLEAHTYISHSSTYLAWIDTLNLFIFLYFSYLKSLLGCTFPWMGNMLRI